MGCRLCSACWIYWKKYGGLKMPPSSRLERMQNHKIKGTDKVRILIALLAHYSSLFHAGLHCSTTLAPSASALAVITDPDPLIAQVLSQQLSPKSTLWPKFNGRKFDENDKLWSIMYVPFWCCWIWSPYFARTWLLAATLKLFYSMLPCICFATAAFGRKILLKPYSCPCTPSGQ